MPQKTKTITIVCPLYRAGEEALRLHQSLQRQQGVTIVQFCYVVTLADGDDTPQILQQHSIPFTTVMQQEFSHSLTRERAAMSAEGEVIVFLTQDVEIEDPQFLQRLTAPIFAGQADATYARQVTKYDNIEKYTREHNYPAQSFTVSQEDLPRLGLKTFFFSDAAGAVRASTFRRLGGYDGRRLPISEDMYFARKLIMSGGRIGYVAEAVVYHSHDFSLSQLYSRYWDTGRFFQQNPEINQENATRVGGGMAKHILRRAWQDKNWKVLRTYVPNMAARYLGMRNGKRYERRRSGKK